MMMGEKRNGSTGGGNGYAWVIPAVLILIVTACIVGIIAYVGDIRENSRQKAIEEYNLRIVDFTVFGDGSYTPDKPVCRFAFTVTAEESRNVLGELTALGLSPVRKASTPFGNTDDVIIEADTDAPEKVIELAEKMNLAYVHAYVQTDVLASQCRAYDEAYDMALSKASMVASNTGLPWKIVSVTELDSSFDPTAGTTSSRVSMTLKVDGNITE